MQKRYYQEDERVWVIGEKTDGIVKSLNIPDKEVTIEFKDIRGMWQEKIMKLWEIDKYRKPEVEEEESESFTYFASVEGGHVPTRNPENAGRDCFVRMDKNHESYSFEHDGILLLKNKVTKLPLGFASYLNKDDLLYIGMERSSVGALGVMVLSGLIDSTYQGEVIAQLMPLSTDIIITDRINEVREFENFTYFPASKALAQAVVIAQSKNEDKVIPYEELVKKPSTRGAKGWGSTDKK